MQILKDEDTFRVKEPRVFKFRSKGRRHGTSNDGFDVMQSDDQAALEIWMHKQAISTKNMS